MRISDWSSDVCSSDLIRPARRPGAGHLRRPAHGWKTYRPPRSGLVVRTMIVRHAVPEAPRRTPGCGAITLRHSHGIPSRKPLPNWQRNASRSEEHTSELQSLMRISYAVFCLKKKNKYTNKKQHNNKLPHKIQL